MTDAVVDLSGTLPNLKRHVGVDRKSLPQYENNLTIFTDLSFDHNTKAAGAGFWMRTTDRKISAGAELDLEHPNTSYGETLAALCGVQIAIDRKLIHEATHVIIVLDNQHAVDLLNKKRAPKEQWEKDALQELAGMLLPFNLRYHVNKVKAHSNNGSARNWVNNKVDTLAKRYMQIARRRINAQKKSVVDLSGNL